MRTVPNHPNYYLGALVGSVCDSLTSTHEFVEHDFRFSIFPNPNDGNFKISYLFPPNKNGLLEIFDVTGKRVYFQTIPPWSTMQHISIPHVSNGIYNAVITSRSERASKKVIVYNE